MKPYFFDSQGGFFAIGLATFSLQYYCSLDCKVNFNVLRGVISSKSGMLSLFKQKFCLTRTERHALPMYPR